MGIFDKLTGASSDDGKAASSSVAKSIDPFGFAKAEGPGKGFEYIAPVKTAKEQHDDEIAWRNSYRNDPKTASYFWAVSRNGQVIVAEYDPCNCDDRSDVDPTAHRNHFEDIPGMWKPVVIGQADSFDRDHNPIKVDVTIPAFAPTEHFEPFTFHGVPVTLEHQSLATQAVDIEYGMHIVWGHRTRQNESAGGSFHVDSLVFGRILVDGTQEITQVYPTGDVFTHSSIQEAHEHEHASFEVPEASKHPGAVIDEAPKADQQ